MGLRQIVSGIDGSQQNIGYSAAVPSGLQYINFFGGSVSPGRNLANGGAAARVVGTPTVGSRAEGVLCTSHASYIQTSVPQSSKMTILGVFCPTSDQRAYVVSNATRTRPIGLSIYSEPTATADVHSLRVQFGGALTGSGVNSLATAAIANAMSNNTPFAFAATLDYSTLSNTAVSIRGLKAGTNQSATASFTSAGSGTPGMLIGSNLDAIAYAGTRVLQTAMWNRVLSDTEIAAQYAQVQKYYSDVLGISI